MKTHSGVAFREKGLFIYLHSLFIYFFLLFPSPPHPSPQCTYRRVATVSVFPRFWRARKTDPRGARRPGTSLAAMSSLRDVYARVCGSRKISAETVRARRFVKRQPSSFVFHGNVLEFLFHTSFLFFFSSRLPTARPTATTRLHVIVSTRLCRATVRPSVTEGKHYITFRGFVLTN